MVKVVAPLFSAEARGSVGGLTYNTYRGQSIVKGRSGPATEFSTRQVAIRALTAAATSSWKSLTAAQRQRWNDFAAVHFLPDWTGQPRQLSGYNWYVKINSVGQDAGLSIITTPPEHAKPAGAPIIELAMLDGHVLATCRNTPLSAMSAPVIDYWCTAALSVARHPNFQAAHHKAYALLNDYADLGTVATALKVTAWARCIDPDDGYQHPWTNLAALTTPALSGFTALITDAFNSYAPIAGATLTVNGVSVQSSASGHATIFGLTPGSIVCEVDKSGYLPYSDTEGTLVAGQRFVHAEIPLDQDI